MLSRGGRVFRERCIFLGASRCLQSKTGKDSIVNIPVEAKVPARTQVVIIGGGLIGNSVAYHLVQNGWKDIVVIDKGNIADGTSKYGSGMLGLFRPQFERSVVKYCIDLYRFLQKKGFDIGLKECGSLNLAASKDRMHSLKRRASRYSPTGLECHVLTPSECLEFHPYLYLEDLQGGVWVPEDATVHPKKVSEALAFLAYGGGARFVGGCGVKKVLTKSSNTLGPMSNFNVKVAGVETQKGTIECDYVVNCAGIWARMIGGLSNPAVKIPICSAEHFFLSFADLPELQNTDLPSVRDYDNHIYLRKWNDTILMGCFERKARPLRIEDKDDWKEITEDHWIHMSPYISSATKRMPILKTVQYDFLLNTPDAFTPDGRWILGEATEVGNYFVCAGMNGNSLQSAGGVGKAVADWMVKGTPPGNMLPFEIQRFTNFHNTTRFLSSRTTEAVGLHYKLQYPLVNEFEINRNIRTSAIFSELGARGAVFGEMMAWERPLYFEQYHNKDDPAAKLPKGTFGKPTFFDRIEEEYLACREGIGVIDMSSFTKIFIKGETNEVVDYLQKLCTNDVDVAEGNIINTAMLNETGGHQNDCLLVRRSLDKFFMICPTDQQTRILEWMKKYLPQNGVSLQDVTSMFTVLSVNGPKSKQLMQEITNTDMTMQPYSFKYVNMGYASGVMVLSITGTGEPGYSLFVKYDQAFHLYDSIMQAGKDYGIKNVGLFAWRFHRIEKFIPFWGEELTSETTPIECGSSFKVRFDKEHFIGMKEMLKQREKGIYKRLAQFHLINFEKDTEKWPWGGEPIYRNGEYVGFVTNSAYGFTLHKMVCLGFIQHPNTIKGQNTTLDEEWLMDSDAVWTINIAGNMYPVSVHLHPPQIRSFQEQQEEKEEIVSKKPTITILTKKNQQL